MNFEKLVTLATTYYQTHKVAAILLVVALGLFALLKPRAFFKLLCFGLFVAVLLYVGSLLTNLTLLGREQKVKMSTKTEKALE